LFGLGEDTGVHGFVRLEVDLVSLSN
jgi:hypothetical protein